MGDFPRFPVLGFGVIFRRSVIPPFLHLGLPVSWRQWENTGDHFGVENISGSRAFRVDLLQDRFGVVDIFAEVRVTSGVAQFDSHLI